MIPGVARTATRAPSERRLRATARYFSVLGDPNRLAVLLELDRGPRTVGELVEATGIPRSRLSNHLACLRHCKFVDAEPEGRSVRYSLAGGDIGELIGDATVAAAARSPSRKLHTDRTGVGVMAETFDLVVIGSGGAAFAAAIRGHELGANVGMVERSTIGGTCVNVGCVPSKALLAAADAAWRSRFPRFAGVPPATGGVDLAALQAQKRHLVGELRQGKYINLATDYAFEMIQGEASFVDGHTVAVGTRQVSARAFVLATGAEPVLPNLDGIGDVDVLTSTTAMELTEIPERLVIVGGGFVGLEQGQLFAHLGAEVTIIGRVAPHAEPELSQHLTEVLTDEGLVMVNDRAVAVEQTAAGIRVTTASGATHTGSHLLVATGRTPRTSALSLDVAGVDTDSIGFIKVDAVQRSTNPAVYAAGDVTGGPQFVYVASAQGAAAAENALTGGDRRVDLTGLPDVIFTNPQLAAAGLTEAQAQAAGHRTDSRVLDLDRVPRALVSHDTRGAIKIVADADTGRILGVHLLAAGAGDVILAGVYAITQAMTIADLASTWTPYLTMGEALRLVAQSFTHDVRKLSCCA